MPTINQLFGSMSVQLFDLIPVFTSGSQTTRRITVAQLLAFIDAQQPANQSTVSTQYAAPGFDGFVVQILQPVTGGPDVHMIMTPLADYPTGTISLPPAATAFDGQQVTVTTTKAITALTINLNGALSSFGLPESLGANDSFAVAYDALSSTWFMIERSVPSPATTNTAQTLINKTLSFPTINGGNLNSITIGGASTGDLTGFTGLPIRTGVAGLAAGMANALALGTSAAFLAAITDETGSGLFVFNNGATLIAPRLGTPFSGVLTNCTGLPIDTGVSGLAAQVATFLGAPSSANLAAAVTDETGTGPLVFGTAPTLTNASLATPTLTAPLMNAPSYGAPVTKTANFTLGATENWVICNGAATITVTLPLASGATGRMVMLKNIAAQVVVSSIANVVPLAGGAAGSAIMPATAGSKVTLVSDGTNWITMA